jgi:hypothetical protein
MRIWPARSSCEPLHGEVHHTRRRASAKGFPELLELSRALRGIITVARRRGAQRPLGPHKVLDADESNDDVNAIDDNDASTHAGKKV